MVAAATSFDATVRSIAPLSGVLGAILVEPTGQVVDVTVTEHGVQFSSDVLRALSISTTFPKELFADFRIEPDSSATIRFAVSLNVLLDCLHVFGPHTATGDGDTNATTDRDARPTSRSRQQPQVTLADFGFGRSTQVSCRFQFSTSTGSLDLVLEDSRGDVLTSCHIATMQPSDLAPADAEFLAYPVTAKVLMQSDCLLDLLQSMDSTIEVITIEFSRVSKLDQTQGDSRQERPTVVTDNVLGSALRICGQGNYGEIETEVVSSSDVILEFEMTSQDEEDESIAFNYDVKLLTHTLKALARSERTSLRINSKGMLSMRFMTRISRKDRIFSEFLLPPSLL